MANNGLIEIAEILKQLNDELKLDNDKWEQANGRSILPTSNAGIARNGNNTTGDDK
jgi:hypothetical protein